MSCYNWYFRQQNWKTRRLLLAIYWKWCEFTLFSIQRTNISPVLWRTSKHLFSCGYVKNIVLLRENLESESIMTAEFAAVTPDVVEHSWAKIDYQESRCLPSNGGCSYWKILCNIKKTKKLDYFLYLLV